MVIASHQVWDDGLTDHIDEGEICYLYDYELLIHRSISEKCKYSFGKGRGRVNAIMVCIDHFSHNSSTVVGHRATTNISEWSGFRPYHHDHCLASNEDENNILLRVDVIT